ITGSTGKTSVRQLTAAVLGTSRRTLASPSSYNNEIGLPATLLQLRAEHQVAVLEMAMRGPGQIRYLAQLAAPRSGVITNIGTSHLGLLGSREAIAQAKGELLDDLGPQGLAVLWAEDPFLPGQAPRHIGRVVWYGFQKPADVRATDLELRGLAGSRYRLQTPRGSVAVELPLPGRHMVLNSLAAAAVGLAVGLDLPAIAAGLAGVGAVPLRLEVVQLRNGARVINDSYNAAPDSVRAALQVLQSEPCRGRRIACLGDIRELGDLARAEHLRLGAELEAVADVVIGVGELGGEIAAGARDRGHRVVHQVADSAEAGALLAALLQPTDLVLLKASRAVELDRALEALERAT
ncbi:MAG: UDP-N-acetylmuramoyl-tripeptide--D-alanyl-D-alanine ligase, partial [Fimbriimonadaceae bacterium]|nr:UDP-N-acetylmuramoyl-tripeptide--D-alanyl-D-alanine ligase [Fimbriimonadaceae bacterium]